ncbi:Transient receptor potential cation channel subfamily A member 1 [Lamellibrachia satsuma]|nr:Transient receptor potential cation channel subfamily A member 1 [Lamellibrachia satsuma]
MSVFCFSWRDMLNVRDKNGLTALDRLIEKLPESAQVVLDHCVERSSRDDDDPTLALIFDYQYIDPGPEDQACEKKRYYALNTMVEHHRDTLLSHPLCQSMLSQKWVRFGRTTFMCNLLIYLGYLLSLTFYVLNVGKTINTMLIDHVNHCPIILNDTEKDDLELIEKYKTIGKMTTEDRKIKDPKVWVVSCILVIFVVIFLVREVTKLMHQRLRYLFNFFNFIPWVMMIATFIFIYPFQKPCLLQWRGAWIALFLAWINFIMYLRRIDFIGIYVIMFVAVLTSLLKAVFMFLLFICAFTGSFYIILSTKPVFRNLWSAMLNIFVMTLGEIQYTEEYVKMQHEEPFSTDINFLLLVFLFLMPIVLMNLMIGIAVGDIEKIQHNAYLKRIALQVELMYMLESSMPKFLQKKAYIRRVTIKPNDGGGQTDCCQKLWRKLLGSSRSVQFIDAERKDHVTGSLDKLREQMSQQQQRIRSMQVCIQQQAGLLQKIASKLDVNNADEPMVEPPGIVYPHSDVGSIYDGLEGGSQVGPIVSSPGPMNVEQMRQKSIRISAERPRSIII